VHSHSVFGKSGSIYLTAYPLAEITCIFNNSKKIEKTPILIVPGIMGTEILDQDILLWADMLRMITPFTLDSFMNPLMFKNDLNPSNNTLQIGNVIKK